MGGRHYGSHCATGGHRADAFPEAEFRFFPDWRKEAAGRAAWQEADALLVWHWRVDQETVNLLEQCRILIRYGVGYDLVDVKALVTRQIPFCNTPDYGTEEVADAACGMILAIQRQLVAYDRACRRFDSGWQEHTMSPQQRTSCQRLGVIGIGRIGTAVVLRMKPFGYRILGYDPYLPSGHEKAVGYQRVESLEELLRQSDIVTIHCPLTEETRGMVNAKFLARMKPGSALVNTARGQIFSDLDCLQGAVQRTPGLCRNGCAAGRTAPRPPAPGGVAERRRLDPRTAPHQPARRLLLRTGVA